MREIVTMKKITLLILLSFGFLSAQEKDFVFGKTASLHSAVLNEQRTINVYLPDDYTTTKASYPVLYVLDGSANEDFIHIAGLVQFMVMSELMPKTIVIGIANVDRRRDFTFPTTIAQDKKDFPTTGGSAKFIDFVGQELLPFIKSHYRVNDQSTILGQSLGGLVLCEMILKNPSFFGTYLIVSPSLWWDNESLLTRLLADPRKSNSTAVVSFGREGKVMDADAHKLVEILTDKGMHVTLEPMPEENHATILHSSVYRSLRLLYRKEK